MLLNTTATDARRKEHQNANVNQTHSTQSIAGLTKPLAFASLAIPGLFTRRMSPTPSSVGVVKRKYMLDQRLSTRDLIPSAIRMSQTVKRFRGQVAEHNAGVRKKLIKAGLEDPLKLFSMDEALRRAGFKSKDI
jgi:hypothetical protein